MPYTYTLVREQWIDLSREQVFEFFKKPENLEKITPQNVHFKILTPSPVSMHVNAEIDYTIKLFGFPMKWKTIITSFDPPQSFSDSQAVGPYKQWVHTHTFEDHGHRTKMTDVVSYQMPYGILGRIAHGLFVKKQLKTIFDYRYRVIEAYFLRIKESEAAK